MSVIAQIPPLFDSQRQSIEFETDRDKILDFSDPGTGKTRSRLEVYSRRRAHGAGCMLVLASKSLLYSAWYVDARRYTPWLAVSCAYAENRHKAFATKADIYVTNHDAVKWLAKQPDSFFAKFTDLVVDESTAYKHHTSQRSKAIAKIKRHFTRRTVQTGTPNTNSVTDMWHQVNIVDDGERLGRSFYAFRNIVCSPEQVGPSARMLKWHDREGAEKAVTDKLADITIRHEFKGVGNRKFIVPFQMCSAHLAKYQQMEDLAAAEVKKGVVISAINAAAVVTKLLQIASGAVYDENGKYHVVNRDRYELVTDLAQERKHLLVFFNWIHQRDLLIEEFKARNMTHVLIDGSVSQAKRRSAVEHFQAGMYQVMLAHPQSAAHGLTLTRGTRTIWASPTYNLEHYIQGNHRVDRAGQTQLTETINVIAEGTIEEHVYSVMAQKRVKLDNVLSYLRDRK